MLETSNLSNNFILAMPSSMQDPNFQRTVIYICEHTEEGTIGLVVNRLSDLTMRDILEQMQLNTESEDGFEKIILQGGPVQPDRGFVLHGDTSKWQSTLKMSNQISITTSQDIISAIAKGEGPSDYLFILGYAGWSAGQLENEIKENAWLCCPAYANILFKTPLVERYPKTLKRLGITEELFIMDAGHS